jgi:hypothetical protein
VPYTDDGALPDVSDETLRAALATTIPYTILILKAGPRFSPPGPDRDPEVAAAIWRHGKRNFALREAGLLAIVCPVADGSNVVGVSVWAATKEDVERIYSQDPAVLAGILVYEIHPTRTFPGSTLPRWTDAPAQ